MRKFFCFFFLLTSSVVNSQEDTTKRFGADIFVSNGFYDIKEIKAPYYKSESVQISYGVRICYRVTPKIKFGIGSSYTEDSFKFQQYDPSYLYSESPSMEKHMAYLDLGVWAGYSVLAKNKLSIYLIGGFMQGKLVKGKDEINSIYNTQSPYSMYKSPYQFSRKVNSFYAGVEIKYQFYKTIGLAITPIYKKTREIAKNEGSVPLVNALISLTFDF